MGGGSHLKPSEIDEVPLIFHRLSASASDGAVLLYWDQSRDHLEVEVMPDASYSWFYRDRETPEVWEETCQRPAVPPRVLAILRRVMFRRAQRRSTVARGDHRVYL